MDRQEIYEGLATVPWRRIVALAHTRPIARNMPLGDCLVALGGRRSIEKILFFEGTCSSKAFEARLPHWQARGTIRQRVFGLNHQACWCKWLV